MEISREEIQSMIDEAVDNIVIPDESFHDEQFDEGQVIDTVWHRFCPTRNATDTNTVDIETGGWGRNEVSMVTANATGIGDKDHTYIIAALNDAVNPSSLGISASEDDVAGNARALQRLICRLTYDGDTLTKIVRHQVGDIVDKVNTYINETNEEVIQPAELRMFKMQYSADTDPIWSIQYQYRTKRYELGRTITSRMGGDGGSGWVADTWETLAETDVCP